MGVSRKCVHTWTSRFDAEGEACLLDRSSRPHSMPNRTSRVLENHIVVWRRRHRCGPDEIGANWESAPARSRASCAGEGFPTYVTVTP
jgi:leucine-zipper of insertion element IS481